MRARYRLKVEDRRPEGPWVVYVHRTLLDRSQGPLEASTVGVGAARYALAEAVSYAVSETRLRRRAGQFERSLDEEAADMRRCVHCGCQFNHHRGGKPRESLMTRRKCPEVLRRGVPAEFPRNLGGADEYAAALDRYWSALTVFRAEE